MPKILTYHNQTNGEHWFTADAYGRRQIDAISDPEGGNTEQPPTSIPSPFAQIDLVRTAFKNIIKDKQLRGTTLDRKLVSDSLDVGELLFNADYIKGQLQLVAWDPDTDLQRLRQSGNEQHRRLGEVLDLYLKQDADTYNFNEIKRLYILYYNYKVVGGTSPTSLFFASSNDLSFVDVPLDKNKLFSGEYPPLYERSESFQLYLYGLLKFYRSAEGKDFRTYFKEVADYLEINLEVLRTRNLALYDRINKLTEKSFLDQFAELDTGSAGDTVELLGFPLRKKKVEQGSIGEQSDFVIQSAKYSKDIKPLVLQNQFNKPYTYVSEPWNNDQEVPYHVAEPLEQRTLPGQVIQYPYLTVSDFLEPYLIKLVYPINRQKYFDGHWAGREQDSGYVLPIIPIYFRFFDLADLQGTVAGGKNTIDMEPLAAGGVRVTLRIPVKQGFVTFERIYTPGVTEGEIPPPEESRNKGVIVEHQFGVTLYPFIKTGNKVENTHYRVQLVDRDVSPHTRYHQYDLQFYHEAQTQPLDHQAEKQRSDKRAADRASTQYYVLQQEFDYMQLQTGVAQGIVVPKFPAYSGGNDTYTFAIDFGTTNTHIEYKVGNGNPRPFDITEEDVQIATLHDPNLAQANPDFGGSGATLIRDLIPQEFLPRYIGQQFEFRFPQRTVIGESHNLNLGTSTYVLSDFNIPFVYEKYPIQKNTRVTTELKWSNYTRNQEDKRRVEAFFENLLFLIRSKVLLNNGDLKKTKRIWFYPSSMVPNRRNSLEATWRDLFHRYITSERDPQKLSESIAPFYFYKERLGKSAADKPSVGIDIGGGTTDIVIFQNNQPTVLTSFRFAANAIFGDGFHGSAAINGFVRRYAEEIGRLLQENRQNELLRVYNAIVEEQRSQDIIAFFFSLEENKHVKEQNIPVSFHAMLKEDEDFKIVFLVFYTAIIYHLAQLMRAKGLEMPRHVLFSGRGSKVVNIVDPSPNLNSLSSLTRLVFKHVYEAEANSIELEQYAEPKEITCKGGLLSDVDVEIDQIKTVLLGTGNGVLVPEQPLKYPEVTDETLKQVLGEVDEFMQLLFTLHDEYNFTHHFGVNPSHLSNYRQMLREDLMEYLKSGQQLKLKELAGNQDVNVEETFFFYPLTGALNRLAFKIATELTEEYN
ncbi:MAG: hypothetical protein ACFB15_27855 [Cyclobacteriaceae bacterium]